jgi:hypothetical protein
MCTIGSSDGLLGVFARVAPLARSPKGKGKMGILEKDEEPPN